MPTSYLLQVLLLILHCRLVPILVVVVICPARVMVLAGIRPPEGTRVVVICPKVVVIIKRRELIIGRIIIHLPGIRGILRKTIRRVL